MLSTFRKRYLLFTLLLLLSATAEALAQQLEAVLIDGKPALKYKDKEGCESPISFGTIAGQKEAITVRVSHFHGSSWGEKG